MKNILGNSIRELRKSKKMTQVELAKKTGYKQNTISNHENGNRQLDERDILIYAQALDVEPQDLFDLSSTTPPTASDSLVTAINNKVVQLDPPRQENVLDYATEQLEEQKRLAEEQEEEESQVEEELYDYKVFERLSAGQGETYTDGYEYNYDLVRYHEDISHDFASWISGDSMEPTYKNGEVALIKATGYDYDGAVYAIEWDGQTYIKKAYKEKDGIRLVSINKKYADKFARYEEEPRIIGKVVDHFAVE